jgi:hypothetical protein
MAAISLDYLRQSGHFAPQISLVFLACLRGQSAVISSDQRVAKVHHSQPSTRNARSIWAVTLHWIPPYHEHLHSMWASWDRRASTEWCSTCFFSSLKLWSYMSNGGATRVLGSLSELRRISRGRIASTCIVASLERRRSALLDPGKPMVQRLAASVADCETGNSFWAGSERVGGRTGDGDPLIKKQVVAQQSR